MSMFLEGCRDYSGAKPRLRTTIPCALTSWHQGASTIQGQRQSSIRLRAQAGSVRQTRPSRPGACLCFLSFKQETLKVFNFKDLDSTLTNLYKNHLACLENSKCSINCLAYYLPLGKLILSCNLKKPKNLCTIY